MDDNELSDIFSKFLFCTDKLETFIELNQSNVENLRSQTKRLYAETKRTYKTHNGEDESLPKLIVDNGFDDEQIWQQLELQNRQFLDSVLFDISELAVRRLEGVAAPRLSAMNPSASEHLEPSDDVDSDSSIELSDDGEYDDFMKRASARTTGKLTATDRDGLPVFADDEEDDLSDEDDREMKLLLDKCEENDRRHADDEGSEMSVSEDGDVDNIDNVEAKDTDEEVDSYDLANKKASGHKLVPGSKSEMESILHKTRKRKLRGSEIDDRFFKMADMESFLRQEELADERRRLGNDGNRDSDDDNEIDNDNDIDMFAELPSTSEDDDDNEDKEGTREMKYSEFFDPPSSENEDENKMNCEDVNKKKSVSFNEQVEENEISDSKLDILSESSDDSADENTKSTFEKRQDRMQKKIKEMEKRSLDPKSWQMSGEVAAIRRPENSLMQEHLDFDHTSRPAPEVTEDSTAKLEELIIQRIKDQIFDDVERQVKPKEDAGEFKKTAILNEEKSKLSLGEIYEAEYQKQIASAKGEEKADVEDPQRVDIKKMMSSLFVKLDALSNFHFTPKQAPVEIRMVSNQPSLTVEDVAPVNMSSADRLAPEEIMDKQRGHFKGDTERNATDKKRDLRQKKKIQHEKRVHRELKDNEKLKLNNGKILSKSHALRNIETANSKEKVKVTLNTEESKLKLTSSKQFFSKLQDEIDTQIISKKAELNKKKANKSKISSSKLKL